MNTGYQQDLRTTRQVKIDFTKKYLLLSAMLYIVTWFYIGSIIFFVTLAVMIIVGSYLSYHIFFVFKNGLEITNEFIRVKKNTYNVDEYTFAIHKNRGTNDYLLAYQKDSMKKHFVLSLTTFDLNPDEVIQELEKYISIEMEASS